MGLFWSLVIGGVAGWFASMLMNRDGDMGILANIVVGIIGGFIGGVIAGWLGVDPEGILGDLAVATLGAVVLLGIVNWATRRSFR